MAARKRRRLADKTEDADLMAGYLVKHLVRNFLLVADDAGLFADSELLDQMSVQSLHCWLPDATNSMQPLWSCDVGWLRRVFALSPFLVSCFACFAQALSPEYLHRLLKADDNLLWSKLQTWQTWRHDHPDEHDCWPPSMATML